MAKTALKTQTRSTQSNPPAYSLNISPENVRAFRRALKPFYTKNRRNFPWREPALKQKKDGSLDAYRILVSEIMLQQTQVSRVVPKFWEFINKFPTIAALANAPLREVLIAWQGLGYNRRAKFLHHAAKEIVARHKGIVPREKSLLIQLPGIGAYTAGAVRAFALNEPDVFLETNIRTVFIYHFLPNEKNISDKLLLLVTGVLLEMEMKRKKSPREFYTTLMDYGAYLKGQGVKTNTQSRHYTKQSTFIGSDRHIRGAMLRALSQKPMTEKVLQKAIGADAARFSKQLLALSKEGFIEKKRQRWQLA